MRTGGRFATLASGLAASVLVTAGCGGPQIEEPESETLRPPAIELPSGREQATAGLPLMLEAWPEPREGTRARVLTDGDVGGTPFEPAPHVSEPLHFAFSVDESPQFLAALVVWKTEASLRVEVRTFLGATPIVAGSFDEIRDASIAQGSVMLPEGSGPFVLELAEPTYAHHFWLSVSDATVVHGITEMSALTAAGLGAIKDGPIEVLPLQRNP